MKNSFGNNLQITLFGESHGPFIGAVLDGLTPGIKIDSEFIAHQLDLRRPNGAISTSRVEPDDFQIVSGVFNDYTTGTPLCILIQNKVQKSKDYSATSQLARPGHADFSAECKYHGFQDYRGGGHFSGRITAALVAAGAIVIPVLQQKGIVIGSHIKSCGNINDLEFSLEQKELRHQLEILNNKGFAVLGDEVGKQMIEEIKNAANDGDSVGGVIETGIVGIPSGVGEPWFDSLESMLGHGLFSIPAVKGVQFGAGFDLVNSNGSTFNDSFCMENGKVVTKTNNNGGINGGISNGMPILFRCAVKPTPSIYKEQDTVNFKQMKNEKITIQGRHDPAIIHRARVVVDSITALVLYDVLIGRFGTDYFMN